FLVSSPRHSPPRQGRRGRCEITPLAGICSLPVPSQREREGKMRLLKRLLPGWITKQLRGRLRAETRSALEANGILASLYTPPSYARHGTWLTWDRQSSRRSAGGLPIPPPQLRMGHAADDQQYLLAGESSAKFIREILEREGVSLTSGNSILEWGCAGGRVLRHFVREAERCDFWGVDQHGPSMSWCKENLSPPFKFLTCTAFPYLPFKDGEFTLVYAGSVFTHILHLMDMWLMEFRRILAPAATLCSPFMMSIRGNTFRKMRPRG